MANTFDPKSIAIYSCGEVIGDGLYKLPFVQECRRRFPAAKITWIAGLGPSVFSNLLAPLLDGLVDEVIEEANIGTFGQLINSSAPINGRRFDLVLDTQRNGMRTICARRIRHGVFLSSTARFFFSSRRPANQTVFPRSLLGQFTFLLDLVSESPGGVPEPIRVGPEFLKSAAKVLPDGPRYVGFAPGAGDKTKTWPLDRFISLARARVEAEDVPVFILGPDERDWTEHIRHAIPQAVMPDTSEGPALVTALGSRMIAAVANDSGAGHMLALSQVPLVSIYSKADPMKYVLNIPRLVVIDSKTYGGTDPSLIPLADVASALESLLD